jgi:nitrogen fixation protein FixH
MSATSGQTQRSARTTHSPRKKIRFEVTDNSNSSVKRGQLERQLERPVRDGETGKEAS